MSLRRWTCLLLGVVLAGCASRPVDRAVDPADPLQFVSWTCDAMFDELDRVQQRAADVAYGADARHGNEVIAVSLGLRVYWPALLAMRPDGPDADALAGLKRRHDALRTVADEKGCGEPLPVLGARQAAIVPLAEGERVAYAERASPRRPTREFGLRLVALRRTQLDFTADLGGQLLLGVWAQDRAGNLLAPPAAPTDAGVDGLVYWTRLLPREFAPGDVMAGELRHTGGAVANVRGQVVATGVHTAYGRPFDVAVIELFGDVAGAAAGRRVEGVMVVDRKIGVLLRLDLRSSQPDFALRRTLLRVEPAS